jgi:hypothetical protein
MGSEAYLQAHSEEYGATAHKAFRSEPHEHLLLSEDAGVERRHPPANSSSDNDTAQGSLSEEGGEGEQRAEAVAMS